jgi:hypothetical protein
VFDLWHYKDPELQPTQKLQVARDRNKSYQAIYNLATKKLVQLSTDSMPNVLVSDDGRTGIASTSVAYNIQRMWGDDGTDVYVVDPATGKGKLIKQKISGQASLSTDGKFVLFFDNGQWYTYAMATGKTVDITEPLKSVHFDQETWSTPDTPSAWGIAGWTKGDKSVLLYDRFDIWELDPTGVKPAVVVTDSLGRKEHIAFRLVDLDRGDDDRAIDPTKPLLLRAFSEVTKASGFYHDVLGAQKAPEKIVMGDLAYGNPQKAKNADVYLVTKSTFVDFPNLWVGPSLTQLTQISDANPFQKEYNWGTAELVTWTSTDGVPLQGILYKPENFDPNKKYPMISYFYEDLSDGLHNYVPPNGRNIINATHYGSNGYLIFEPDVGNRESGIENPRDASRGASDIPRVLLFPIPYSRCSRCHVKHRQHGPMHPLERDAGRAGHRLRRQASDRQRHVVESIRGRRGLAHRDDHVIRRGGRWNHRDRRALPGGKRQRMELIGRANLVLEVACQALLAERHHRVVEVRHDRAVRALERDRRRVRHQLRRLVTLLDLDVVERSEVRGVFGNRDDDVILRRDGDRRDIDARASIDADRF